MAAGELRVRDGWQILTDWPRLSGKATKMLQAMVAAAPAGTVVSDTYRGKHRGLMLYGPGSPMRLPFVRSHVAQGGRVAMWDMGYWERKEAMRLSIDSLHPTPAQLDMAPAGPGRREFELREDANPAGPIMLEEAMRGCSLVVSHHSNCSVDAVVAGVPFETEGGAAAWFKGREFTRENRAEFLRLLSWWEWRRDEAPAAWKWIEKVTNGSS
jgi:hypothetical protein